MQNNQKLSPKKSCGAEPAAGLLHGQSSCNSDGVSAGKSTGKSVAQSKVKADQQITADAITTMTRQLGSDHRLVSNSSKPAVMKGHFAFLELGPGFSFHCCDVLEEKDAASSNQTASGLSFNLVLKGAVQFSLGTRRYQLAVETPRQPICSLVAVNRPELFTRYTRQGQWVKKINLSVSCDWLQQRCHAEQDWPAIQQVLDSAPLVTQWLASPLLARSAKRLLALSRDKSLNSRIALEAEAFRLLGLFLENMTTQVSGSAAATAPQQPSLPDTIEWQLMQRIDGQLRADPLGETELGLNRLASSQGMSVSTLQRRFKARYGITVMDYVRRRKLERAREALMFEGVSIGEAAYSAGYNHPSNFITAFKREFDTTPSHLLRLHQGAAGRDCDGE